MCSIQYVVCVCVLKARHSVTKITTVHLHKILHISVSNHHLSGGFFFLFVMCRITITLISQAWCAERTPKVYIDIESNLIDLLCSKDKVNLVL